MWTKTTALVASIFLIAFAGYVAITRLNFEIPVSAAAGEECGFTAADFAGGTINYSETGAWWTSFTRKQDYLSAFSIAVSLAFASFVLVKARQISKAAAAGSLAGGGLLVGIALSLSCLAPILAVAGVGVFASFGLAIVAIPKWLVALITVGFVAWGYWYVSKKASACPLKKCPTAEQTGDICGIQKISNTAER